MEDVLRKIYLQKHHELEKKKLDRKLNLDQPQKRKRVYKNIFQDYLPLTQSFDLETELQMKKNIQFGNDFLQQKHRYKVKSVSSPFDTKYVSLPPIRSHRGQVSATDLMTQQQMMLQLKNPQRFKARQKQIQRQIRIKYVKKRFRIQITTIVFISRLSSMRKKTLLSHLETTQSLASNLLQTIDKMVNKYYKKVLQQQLLKYLQLIKIKIQQPKMMLQKQIINMLYFMSKQLAESAIIKELMGFIMAISRNGSFFPSDYLTETETIKLQFDMNYGCIKNLQEKQKKMIIAVCVGLKIFCSYILYRPWILTLEKSPISPQQIINEYPSVIKLIHGTASVFYYIIMEQFCDPLEAIQELKPALFKKLNIQIQKFVNIFPKDYDQEIICNSNQIFPNQKKNLFINLREQNPQTFVQIRQNIIIWIERIYNATLKEEQKNQLQRRKKIKEEQKQIIRYVVGKAKSPPPINQAQKDLKIQPKNIKDKNSQTKIFNRNQTSQGKAPDRQSLTKNLKKRKLSADSDD